VTAGRVRMLETARVTRVVSEDHEDEPEDALPPTATPPEPDKINPPENPLIAGMLKALEEPFKKVEVAVTNLERRAVDQQKQLEDLASNTTKLVEEKVIEAIKVYEQSRLATEQASVIPPGQTPFDRPVGGGIGGFMQQIIGWVMSPSGQQLVGNYLQPRTPGLITIDANDIFGQSIEKTIRNVAVGALRDRFGSLPDLSIESTPTHQVVGDHV
jgi:hypothetical protein